MTNYNRGIDLWRGQWPSKVLERMMTDSLFEDSLTSKALKDFSPGAEVNETKTTYSVKFDLPGLKKEDIKIDLHDNRLTVSGERTEEKKTEDKEHYTHMSEVRYGSFMRSFTFPIKVDAEKVEAKYDNGVLVVNLEKTTTNGSRTISVK
jgi:HSP20 family protein